MKIKTINDIKKVKKTNKFIKEMAALTGFNPREMTTSYHTNKPLYFFMYQGKKYIYKKAIDAQFESATAFTDRELLYNKNKFSGEIRIKSSEPSGPSIEGKKYYSMNNKHYVREKYYEFINKNVIEETEHFIIKNALVGYRTLVESDLTPEGRTKILAGLNADGEWKFYPSVGINDYMINDAGDIQNISETHLNYSNDTTDLFVCKFSGSKMSVVYPLDTSYNLDVIKFNYDTTDDVLVK